MNALLQAVRFKECANWSVAHLLESQFNYNQDYELVRIGDFLTRNKMQIIVQDDIEYKRVTIKMNNGGIYLRDKKPGKDIGTKKQYLIKEGQFLLSKIDARNGAFGVVTKEVDNAIITGNFWTFDVDYSKIDPHFLSLITTTKQFKRFSQSASSGTTGRHYLNEKRFLDVKIPLPSLKKQKDIIENIQKYENQLSNLKKQYSKLLNNFNQNIFPTQETKNELLEFLNYSKLGHWSANQYLTHKLQYNEIYSMARIGDFLTRNKTQIIVQDDVEYKRVTIKMNNGGIYLRDKKFGKDIGTKKQYLIKEGQFLLSKIDARNGAFGVVTKEVDNAIITGNFWTFDVDYSKIDPHFLSLITTTKQFKRFSQSASSGTTGRHYLNEKRFLDTSIPLPSLKEQKELTRELKNNIAQQSEVKSKINDAMLAFKKEIFDEA